MNREIKEMAEEIYRAGVAYGSDFAYKSDHFERLAKVLYNAGYRKIDGDTSDGYHTFNELYHHRAVLFAMICNQNNSLAWKSKKHSDGTMFDNMFIVGIETAQGQATYHYDILPYWDYFKVKELETAPIWDGHTPSQAIDRIFEMSKEAKGYRKQSDTIKEFAEKIVEDLEKAIESNMKGSSEAMKNGEPETYNYCLGKRYACHGIMDLISQLKKEYGVE